MAERRPGNDGAPRTPMSGLIDFLFICYSSASQLPWAWVGIPSLRIERVWIKASHVQSLYTIGPMNGFLSGFLPLSFRFITSIWGPGVERRQMGTGHKRKKAVRGSMSLCNSSVSAQTGRQSGHKTPLPIPATRWREATSPTPAQYCSPTPEFGVESLGSLEHNGHHLLSVWSILSLGMM